MLNLGFRVVTIFWSVVNSYMHRYLSNVVSVQYAGGECLYNTPIYAWISASWSLDFRLDLQVVLVRWRQF